jgi:hypothetical protein
MPFLFTVSEPHPENKCHDKVMALKSQMKDYINGFDESLFRYSVCPSGECFAVEFTTPSKSIIISYNYNTKKFWTCHYVPEKNLPDYFRNLFVTTYKQVYSSFPGHEDWMLCDMFEFNNL